jgi:hypothetical protein
VLDVLVGGAVEGPPQVAPPASPVVGTSYLVGDAPSGAWVGKQQSVAAYSSGGWRFVVPVEGLTVYMRASDTWAAYRNGTWELGTVRGSSLVLGGQQVVGVRAAAIGSPSGGSTIDAQARSTINQILGALRQHGLIET